MRVPSASDSEEEEANGGGRRNGDGKRRGNTRRSYLGTTHSASSSSFSLCFACRRLDVFDVGMVRRGAEVDEAAEATVTSSVRHNPRPESWLANAWPNASKNSNVGPNPTPASPLKDKSTGSAHKA